MKRLGTFLKGIFIGALGTLVAVWKWEKQSRKKVSTVLDKAYKNAYEFVSAELERLEGLKEKVSAVELKKIFAEAEEKIKNQYKLTKKQLDKIIARVRRSIKNREEV